MFASLILSGYMLVVFCVALWKQDNSLVDTAYGIGFVLVTVLLFSRWENPLLRHSLLLWMVSLWGIRLAVRIRNKNYKKPEDFRYRAWRESWIKRSMLYFFFRSLIQIYLLQASIILLVLAPILIAFSQAIPLSLHFVNILGCVLWGVGFFFEVVGDAQLDTFLKDPNNKGKIMMRGLWKYTRHPNYFGEASMWWGIWLLVVDLPLGPFAIISPILITWLLLKVSGIPMLEAKWQGNPEWEEYKRTTSAFFPWMPKKSILPSKPNLS